MQGEKGNQSRVLAAVSLFTASVAASAGTCIVVAAGNHLLHRGERDLVWDLK